MNHRERNVITMMTKDEIIAMLKEAGVLLEGHFLLTSGRHSDRYMQCAKIFQNAKIQRTPLRGAGGAVPGRRD